MLRDEEAKAQPEVTQEHAGSPAGKTSVSFESAHVKLADSEGSSEGMDVT